MKPIIIAFSSISSKIYNITIILYVFSIFYCILCYFLCVLKIEKKKINKNLLNNTKI